MTIEEMRKMEDAELKNLIDTNRDKIRALRFAISGKRIANHRQYRQARTELAQLLTVEKERAQ